jgi:hypothetical protein
MADTKASDSPQLQLFRDFIASKTWTFAKTMPEIPQYYKAMLNKI